ASCRARRDAFARQRDTFVTTEPARVWPKGTRGSNARRWALVTASCGALALAAAILLVLRPKPGVDGTRLKGAPRLDFYLKRGALVTRGGDGARLRPGDSLRFVYTSAEPRYLAVLSLDGARHASVYYPGAVQNAERIPAAVDRALEASTVLDATL